MSEQAWRNFLRATGKPYSSAPGAKDDTLEHYLLGWLDALWGSCLTKQELEDEVDKPAFGMPQPIIKQLIRRGWVTYFEGKTGLMVTPLGMRLVEDFAALHELGVRPTPA